MLIRAVVSVSQRIARKAAQLETSLASNESLEARVLLTGLRLDDVNPIRRQFGGTQQYLEFNFNQSVQGVFQESSVAFNELTDSSDADYNTDYFNVSYSNGGKRVQYSWPSLPARPQNPAAVLPNGVFSATLLLPVENQEKSVLIFSNLQGDFGNVDANGSWAPDDNVNFDDLLRFAQNYGKTSNVTHAMGDANYDGAINFDDLLIVAQQYSATPLDVVGINKLSVGLQTDQTASLLWTPPASTISFTHFYIERSEVSATAGFEPVPGGLIERGAVIQARYAFQDIGLKDGTKYWYRVSPSDVDPTIGAITKKTTTNVKSITTVLPMPTEFEAVEVRQNSVTITWRDNAQFEDGYYIWLSTDGGETWNPDPIVYTAINPKRKVTFQLNSPGQLNLTNDYVIKMQAFSGTSANPRATSAQTLGVIVQSPNDDEVPLNVEGPSQVAFGEEAHFTVSGGTHPNATTPTFYEWTVVVGRQTSQADLVRSFLLSLTRQVVTRFTFKRCANRLVP